MLVKLQGLTDACNALIHFSSLKYTWYSTEQTVNKLQLETIGQFRLSHPVEVKPTKKKVLNCKKPTSSLDIHSSSHHELI